MNSQPDRRAPRVHRIPFDGVVEMGGTLDPSFEAQAVNLSEKGMQLKTAYLPEIGQPVRCCFDAGLGMSVVASGEVAWNEKLGSQGGEFGIRFTNLDNQSTALLKRIVGMGENGTLPMVPDGRKVRLHIEGLASPMRARIKNAHGSSVTAFSELGFLQVGKGLELEDATNGERRPAFIDRVSVEVERESRIPQLVVTLRYDDKAARSAMTNGEAVAVAALAAVGTEALASSPMASEASSHDEPSVQPSVQDASIDDQDDSNASARTTPEAMPDIKTDGTCGESEQGRRNPVALATAKIGPALARWAKRAKTTVAVLASRASAKGGAQGDLAAPVRRTTAPPPGGGLRAAGRKVVRGGEVDEKVHALNKPHFKITKKRIAVAGATAAAITLAAIALHKPAPAASVAPAESVAVASSANGAPSSSAAPPASVALAAAPIAPIASAARQDDPLAAQAKALAASDASSDTSIANANSANSANSVGPKKLKVTPFGNGPVGHGNVMRIKMDGAIEKIHGASQPAGFTVVIPGRKSLEAAGPLAAKDSRIAAIRVANETGGAELTVTFKDGVPNYQVRGKGDTLELVLAKAGQAGDKAPEAHVKKKKHSRTHH
ncbi:MAG: PilZ domain-containing protein [Polyangiaceae bacterium]|nr:PilZ domain-containing protein [Polyangiaceae bacterium]